MNLFPTLRDFRENLVMGTAYDALLLAPMNWEPAAAAGYVAHVAIKHGDGGRCLFHE
jgi:hypothetical protein